MMRSNGVAHVIVRVLHAFALIVTIAVAVTLTLLLPNFYAEWNPGGRSGHTGLPTIFLFIEPLVAVAGWVALWALFRRRLLIPAAFLALAVFGPWGINVELAVVPLALAFVLVLVSLGVRLARSRRGLTVSP